MIFLYYEIVTSLDMYVHRSTRRCFAMLVPGIHLCDHILSCTENVQSLESESVFLVIDSEPGRYEYD